MYRLQNLNKKPTLRLVRRKQRHAAYILRYSSLEKFEDDFDTFNLGLMQKKATRSSTNDGKVVGTLVFAKIGVRAKCGELSNCFDNRFYSSYLS